MQTRPVPTGPPQTRPERRLLDAAAARLVAATVPRPVAGPAALDALSDTARGWRALSYAEGAPAPIRSELAESLSRLGHARVSTGRRSAADALGEAISHRRRLPADDPAPRARDLSLLGAVQMMADPDTAPATLAEAIALLRRLVEVEPWRWSGPLARASLCFAATLADRGRSSEAVAVTDGIFDLIDAGRVDIDRDAFRRPLAALVAQLAPWHDDSPDAMVLRLRLSGLAPKR